MCRRQPHLFSDVPAFVELLETRRLLSADPATLGTPTQSANDATEAQPTPKIASDDNGDYIVVWKSNSQGGLSASIIAQEFDADGKVLGMPLIVSQNSSTLQGEPSVAMNATGEFVIAWTTMDQDGSGSSINVQRYGLGGTTLGDAITFANTLTGNESSPSVAIDAKGDFVVAWLNETGPDSSARIFAQRFNAAGSEEGSAFLVGQSTTAAQAQPTVAMDTAGDFVITWQSIPISGGMPGIEAQLYNSSGMAMGGELKVSPTNSVNPMFPTVAMDAAGDFLIAWQSGIAGQTNIYAEHFNVTGQSQGSLFQVSDSSISQNNMTPTVAMDAGGNFVVGWAGNSPNSSEATIFAQRYNALGISQGSIEQFINSTTISQQSPAVVLQPDGNVVVAWNGSSQSNTNSGVYTQQSGQAAVLQTGLVPTSAGPTQPAVTPGDLPVLLDAGQLGDLNNIDAFFMYPGLAILYPGLAIQGDFGFYPQGLSGTTSPWFAQGLNSLYDELWYGN